MSRTAIADRKMALSRVSHATFILPLHYISLYCVTSPA